MTAVEKSEKVEDVEMKEEPEKEEKKDPDLLTVEDIREHCKLIRRSVDSKETRFVQRVLRALPVTRRKLNPVVLRTILKTFFTAEADRETKEFLLEVRLMMMMVVIASTNCSPSRLSLFPALLSWTPV